MIAELALIALGFVHTEITCVDDQPVAAVAIVNMPGQYTLTVDGPDGRVLHLEFSSIVNPVILSARAIDVAEGDRVTSTLYRENTGRVVAVDIEAVDCQPDPVAESALPSAPAAPIGGTGVPSVVDR